VLAGGIRQTVVLGGVAVDVLTEQEAIDHIVGRARAGVGGLVVTPNVDHLRQLSRGGGLSEAYERATLTLADGQPLVWASRLQGQPLPERVAGSSLLWSLAAAAADEGLGVALIGGAEGSAGATASELLSRSPTLDVRLVATPRVSPAPTTDEVDGIAALIEGTRPSIVFLAFGAPKQELLGAALRERFPGLWLLGVGASFEMASGSLPRAPLLLQRAGLEWLWRLAVEPRRLARRYLLEDLPYVPRLFGQAVRERLRSRAARRSGPAG
jgi:N-acetylglucosaminyldiphosphoundecaprenol N-acetyl-beta-D-mannosaminyltransferase